MLDSVQIIDNWYQALKAKMVVFRKRLTNAVFIRAAQGVAFFFVINISLVSSSVADDKPDLINEYIVQWTPIFLEAQTRAIDNPQATLNWLSLPSEDESTREQVWRNLAIAYSNFLLENMSATNDALSKAELLLNEVQPPDHLASVMLQSIQLLARIDILSIDELHSQLAELHYKAKVLADPRLHCELTSVSMFILRYVGDFDGAWLASEKLEDCATSLDIHHLLAPALATMGSLLLTLQGESAIERATLLFESAENVFLNQSARYQRALVVYEAGFSMLQAGLYKQALLYFERAIFLYRELQELTGVAITQVLIARVWHAQQQYQFMLEPLNEAEQYLRELGLEYRRSEVLLLRLLALSELHQSQNPALAKLASETELRHALSLAKSAEQKSQTPSQRARLLQAISASYAALSEFSQAYEALLLANVQAELSRAQARDTEVLNLQARYDIARRDAENTELRYAQEAARLALEIQTARQRMMLMAIVGLALLLLAFALWIWRALQRRRALNELALRDELTGAPNRRAVMAYAKRCWQHTGKEPVLALIDLDYFKRVNDVYGHLVGDAVLCALASAVMQELRSDDLIGRWGGEEWLLVLPGASIENVPNVFERIRRCFSEKEVSGMPSPHGVTFSMGAVITSGRYLKLEQALEVADKALYRAKAQGRDQLVIDYG